MANQGNVLLIGNSGVGNPSVCTKIHQSQKANRQKNPNKKTVRKGFESLYQAFTEPYANRSCKTMK